MKNLKIYILLIPVILILSGCSTYQYLSVDSYLDKNREKEFVFENDSVRINYDFSGQNFSVKYNIFNKLDKPLYIDWNNSSVQINDDDYYDAYYDQTVNIVAPNSYLNIQSNFLINNPIEISPNDTLTNMGLQAKADDGSWVKYAFSDEISPVFFTNILSLSYNSDLSEPVFTENSFWISKLLQTTTKNNKFVNSPNHFYFKKENGTGSFFSSVTALILAILLSALGGGE